MHTAVPCSTSGWRATGLLQTSLRVKHFRHWQTGASCRKQQDASRPSRLRAQQEEHQGEQTEASSSNTNSNGSGNTSSTNTLEFLSLLVGSPVQSSDDRQPADGR